MYVNTVLTFYPESMLQLYLLDTTTYRFRVIQHMLYFTQNFHFPTYNQVVQQKEEQQMLNSNSQQAGEDLVEEFGSPQGSWSHNC